MRDRSVFIHALLVCLAASVLLFSDLLLAQSANTTDAIYFEKLTKTIYLYKDDVQSSIQLDQYSALVNKALDLSPQVITDESLLKSVLGGLKTNLPIFDFKSNNLALITSDEPEAAKLWIDGITFKNGKLDGVVKKTIYADGSEQGSEKPILLVQLPKTLFIGSGTPSPENAFTFNTIQPTLSGYQNNAFVKTEKVGSDNKEMAVFWSEGQQLVAARGGWFWGGEIKIGPRYEKILTSGTHIAIDGNSEFTGNLDYNLSTYTFIGTVRILNHLFSSDENDPLVFRLEKGRGFTHQWGTGAVMFPDGRTVVLKSSKGAHVGSPEYPLPPQTTSCEENCRDMFNKGELKKGMTIEQCIELLCKKK